MTTAVIRLKSDVNESITLAEFIAGLSGLPRQGTLWDDGVRLMLNAVGPLNAHLAFPSDASQLARNRYDRSSPLPLDTPIYGDFLVLTYYGHEPSLILTEHASLDDMKNRILDESGSLNIWTDAQFAFHGLRPLPFVIRYTNRHGNSVVFDIENPEIVKTERDLEQGVYRNVQLDWLPPNSG